jgi:hypothetical protein
MGTVILLISNVCIVEGNGQVSFDFLTTDLKGAIDPKINKPASMFHNFPIWLMPNYQRS